MIVGTFARSFLGLFLDTVHCSDLGRDNGFGNNYVWAGSLESGLQIAKAKKRPLMLIIHKSWCKACKKLKPKFASSTEIQSLSKHFVMVNLVDDEEPKSIIYAPDGDYIPRVLFVCPSGDVDTSIYNEAVSSENKFFYSKPEDIARSMKTALDKYQDNGFGNNYVWAGSLESGLQIATHHRKPVMLIIHKSWCTACKNLKPKFATSTEIQSLSKHFVMVNLVDDEEPKNTTYAPDGTYIPRILFLSPSGYVDSTIYNEEGSSQHKFFYSRPEQIARSMRIALDKYKHEQIDI